MLHRIGSLFLAVIAVVPPQGPSASQMSDDVARVASAASNEARFETIASLLRASGLAFTVEPFTLDAPLRNEPRTDGRNVVVTLGEGGEHLVVGAHYDAVRLPDGSLSRGAVDNAASSIVLVRLGQALRSERLEGRVSLVWFDMEELGLVGSSRYVQRHEADRPSAMINLDINAYGETILFGPSQRPEGRALRQMVLAVCAAEDVPCVPFPQMPPGDDRSFVKAGIPTLSLAILPAVEAHHVWMAINGGEAGAPAAMDNPPAILQTIHTAADTTDKVSEASMATMLRFTTRLVRTVLREP